MNTNNQWDPNARDPHPAARFLEGDGSERSEVKTWLLVIGAMALVYFAVNVLHL
jgi:hypothetical protein